MPLVAFTFYQSEPLVSFFLFLRMGWLKKEKLVSQEKKYKENTRRRKRKRKKETKGSL